MTGTETSRPGFPGGTSVSRLCVYDWAGPDGARSGSPHLHTASAEGYVVIGGTGRVQTLTMEGFNEHSLVPGALVWFTPGTVHRLINDGGDLEIVVVMENAGLPEAGDAVLTLPFEYLDDPQRYAEQVRLPDPAADDPGAAAAARARRDLALAGWNELVAAAGSGNFAPLARLYESAAGIVAGRIPHWRPLWRNGPMGQAELTGRQLEALERADGTHLHSASVATAESGPSRGFGMCGRLQKWDTRVRG